MLHTRFWLATIGGSNVFFSQGSHSAPTHIYIITYMVGIFTRLALIGAL
jgi:hypothetical protein